MKVNLVRIVRTNVDATLIADQRNFKAKYLRSDEETELNSRSISNFNTFYIMLYFIYTYILSSLLDPRLVDLGSTLIHVSACNP